MNQSFIRNFAIIAHIDHGKSTLADRLLELTGTITKRDMQEQILDSNPIERERGITIKLAPVRMKYKTLSVVSDQLSEKQRKNDFTDNRQPRTDNFILNLIDTPGHVDFSYEVSRSLAACEGALLVVDATQGVQAQTLANLTQARKHNLTIIPIINKIDLPNARIETSMEELSSLGFGKEEVLTISAKTGQNVEKVLERIVERIPPPRGEVDKPLRALVFSSQYDTHKGVVVFVRVVDGSIGPSRGRPLAAHPSNRLEERVTRVGGPPRRGPLVGVLGGKPEAGPAESSMRMTVLEPISRAGPIHFLASGVEVIPIEIGYFSPHMVASGGLVTGEVGYIATGLKDAKLARVGDTVTVVNSSSLVVHSKKPSTINHEPSTLVPLPGYQSPKSMVFLGLFPINSEDITLAREAMERLQLSDSAFSFRPIHSAALGNGFHCGFLGLLHAEIVQERLSREFNLNMIATAPSVEYRIKLKMKNEKLKMEDGYYQIQSASEFPDPSLIEEVREPIMNVTIYSPKKYVGPITQLSQEKRGELVDLTYQAEQATFSYLLPLSEMIVDFFDRLKSITEGYASLDYEFFDYQKVEVVKVDILVNKEKVDALSFLAVEDRAVRTSREIVERLVGAIPRQQFEIPVQAAIGGQVIARADVKSFRKDVIQKLYGGDRTRKDKLLDKQKKGKAKMKLIGRVQIPQEAFFTVLKRT